MTSAPILHTEARIIREGAELLALAREAFVYNPDTGDLTWTTRPRSHFVCDGSWKGFNTRRPGHTLRSLSGTGYIRTKFFGVYRSAHRIAWLLHYGSINEELCVDHINGDKLDNRIINLRQVAQAENLMNVRRRSDNKSGVTGVFFEPRKKRWRALITCRGVNRHIGYFLSKEEAVAARLAAQAEYGFGPSHGAEVTARHAAFAGFSIPLEANDTIPACSSPLRAVGAGAVLLDCEAAPAADFSLLHDPEVAQ